VDHPGPQNVNNKLLKTIMSKSLQHKFCHVYHPTILSQRAKSYYCLSHDLNAEICY